jgi:hypothetical protein
VTLRAEGLRGRAPASNCTARATAARSRRSTTATGELPPTARAARARLPRLRGGRRLDAALRAAPLPEESQLDDNEDTRFLRVNDEKIRVLYLEERPRWEYRYVKNVPEARRPEHRDAVDAVRREPDASNRSTARPAAAARPAAHREGAAAVPLHPASATCSRAHRADRGRHRRQWLETARQVRRVRRRRRLLVRRRYSGDARALPQHAAARPLPVVLEDQVWLQQQNAAARPHVPQRFSRTRCSRTTSCCCSATRRSTAGCGKKACPGFYSTTRCSAPSRARRCCCATRPTKNNYGKRPIAVVGPYPRGTTFFLATDETWRWRDPYGETYMDAFWRNVVRHLAQGRLQRRNDLLELRSTRPTSRPATRCACCCSSTTPSCSPPSPPSRRCSCATRRADREAHAARGARRAGLLPGELHDGRSGAYSFLVFANQNPADTVLAREDVLVKVPDKEMAHIQPGHCDPAQHRRSSRGLMGQGATSSSPTPPNSPSTSPAGRPSRAARTPAPRPAWDSAPSLLLLLGVLGGRVASPQAGSARIAPRRMGAVRAPDLPMSVRVSARSGTPAKGDLPPRQAYPSIPDLPFDQPRHGPPPAACNPAAGPHRPGFPGGAARLLACAGSPAAARARTACTDRVRHQPGRQPVLAAAFAGGHPRMGTRPRRGRAPASSPRPSSACTGCCSTEIGGVVPVAPGRFLGLRLAVLTTMANLPAAANGRLRDPGAPRSRRNFADRPLEQLDPDQLLLLAATFPHRVARPPRAPATRRPRARSGPRHRGRSHYRLALDGSPIGSATNRSSRPAALRRRLLPTGTARAARDAGRLPTPPATTCSASCRSRRRSDRLRGDRRRRRRRPHADGGTRRQASTRLVRGHRGAGLRRAEIAGRSRCSRSATSTASSSTPARKWSPSIRCAVRSRGSQPRRCASSARTRPLPRRLRRDDQPGHGARGGLRRRRRHRRTAGA